MADNIDLFQRLSFDGTISRVFGIYIKGFKPLVTISAVLLLIPILISAFVMLSVAIKVTGFDVEQMQADPYYVLNHAKELYAVSYLSATPLILVDLFSQACLVHATMTLYLKKPVDVKDCIKKGLKKFCTILGSGCLKGLIVVLGLLLLLAPGIYIGVRLFVIIPVIMVENTGVVESLKRSFALVQGSWCYVFCVCTVVMFLSSVGQGIWNVVMQPVFGQAIVSKTGTFAVHIWVILFAPLAAIMQSVMYINLRVEKEGLNADVLFAEFGRSASHKASADDIEEIEEPLLMNNEADEEQPPTPVAEAAKE